MLSATSLTLVGPSYASEAEDLRRDLDEAQAEIAELKSLVQQLVSDAKEEQSAVIEPIEIEERLTDLEDVIIEHDERIGDRAVVSAFDAVQFDLGGFFDSTASVVIGDDETTAAFNKQVFELLVHADIGERWDLFVAQAFVRNAPLQFTDPAEITSPEFANNNSPVVTDTVIAWGQYQHSDQLNIQFGRYITPIGIINVEHFPATLLDTDQPMFLRPFPGQTLFANFTNGVNIYGAFHTGERGENTLEYSVFGGAWAGNATNYSAGGRLRYGIGNTGLKIGGNVLTGDRSSDIANQRFTVFGGDFLYDKGRIILKAEAFYSVESTGDDRQAFYIQPGYRFTPKLTGFYRYDFLDDGSASDAAKEHVAGIVYDPITNVRLRLIYRRGVLSDALGLTSASTDTIQFKTTLNF